MSDEITQRKNFIINTIYAVLIIALIAICLLSASVIMPFWIALLLAAVMQPLTRLLDKKLPIKKNILSMIVCLIFYVIIGGAIVWMISGALYLLEQAFTELPAYYNSTIKPALDSSGNFAESVLSILPAQVRPDLETINTAIAGAVQNFVTGLSQKGVTFAGSFVSAIPSSFLSVLITILLSFFINMQYDDVIHFLKCQLPEKIRNSTGELKQLVKSSLFKYLKSTLILMLITMAELTVGFLVIRVSNPIGLAVGIAIFDALPVFGVGTIMIPWAIIELINENYALAAGLAVVYVIVDIMRNIWEPKIIGTQFELNPIVALVTVYAGYQLAGIFGMIGLLITVYILLTFHKAGKIKLYNSPVELKISNTQKRRNRMENNNLEREITTASLLKFAFPTIVVMIFSTLYGMVDGVFVTRLINTDALSAVNIVMPLITIATSLGMMFATGGSAITAKLIGENQLGEARQTFSLMVAATFITGVVLSALGLVFIKPLLSFMGATQDIYQYCHDYAFYVLLIMPVSMASMVFQVFFITAGKSTLGMIVNIVSGVTNIVLDYVLIKHFSLGISGAAIATSLGFAITTITGLVYFSIDRKNVLYLTRPKLSGSVLLRSCTNGASEMVSNLSQSITLLLYNNVLIRIAGVDGVAAITILLYATDLLIAIFMGYATGISPLISYNFGKNEQERLKKIHSISLKSITLFSVIIFLAGQTAAGSLVSSFSPAGTHVYDLAVHGFRIFAVSFLFMGISIYGSAMFTSFSDGKVSAIISAMRTFVFLIIAVLVLSIALKLDGVWLSLPVAELLGMIVTAYFFKKYKDKYHFA